MKYISTAELARQIGYHRGSIENALSIKGSFWGVVPKKLPSGRLLWPEDTVDRLARERPGRPGGKP